MGCGKSAVETPTDVTTAISNIANSDAVKYITTDVKMRNSRGRKMTIDTQLRNQRIEVICIGCYLSSLGYSVDGIRDETISSNVNVLYRDECIKDSNLPEELKKYRPDLVITKTVGTRTLVYHVEIDENGHGGYNTDDEVKREGLIRGYFTNKFDEYKLIRFNPHAICKNSTINEKLLVAEKFKDMMNSVDGIIRIV